MKVDYLGAEKAIESVVWAQTAREQCGSVGVEGQALLALFCAETEVVLNFVSGTMIPYWLHMRFVIVGHGVRCNDQQQRLSSVVAWVAILRAQDDIEGQCHLQLC